MHIFNLLKQSSVDLKKSISQLQKKKKEIFNENKINFIKLNIHKIQLWKKTKMYRF